MTGVDKQRQLSELAAKYAMDKIVPLQEAYLGANNARSAWARATLAKLRRLDDVEDSSWFSLGDQLFDQWPAEKLAELGATSRDEELFLRAVKSALSLYSLHQQSSKSACALVRRQNEADEEYKMRRNRAGFGKCCRRIEPDLDGAKGVQRRLMAIESASEFDRVFYGLKGLIRLIKSSVSAEIDGLDYYALAQDLYLLQLSGSWRDSVFSRWSKGYFSLLD